MTPHEEISTFVQWPTSCLYHLHVDCNPADARGAGVVSLPREVIPGRFYMVTRRCTQREFLLRPDAATNNAFLYCLADAAQRCQITVLLTCALSNHHHTIVFDPDGNLPAFTEHFHKLLAKSQNALRGRWENFWSAEQVCVVRLVDPADVLHKLVYVATNPVNADQASTPMTAPAGAVFDESCFVGVEHEPAILPERAQ
jgi:REP element-mobilizing transposase RayT